MKKLKKYISRKRSALTGNTKLEHLYTFKNFPVFFGCTDTSIDKDLIMDMSWVIDPESGIIQLKRLVPFDLLYKEQHADTPGERWMRYFQAFVDFIKKQKVKHVLEIGGGVGKAARLFIDQTTGTDWVMVEPNPTYDQECRRIKIIKGFFDNKFKYNRKFDSIVMSQVIEHLYNPVKFLKDAHRFLRVKDKLIVAHPNLLLMLQKKYTNSLNFEHTLLLTDYFMEYLFAVNGFKLLYKEFYLDHSMFYCVEKVDKKIPVIKLENKYREYKKIFLDFVNYHLELIQTLNKKLEDIKEPVYLFGAHIFSQYLIAMGLETEKIVNILDNSLLKQDRRLYGTNLMVKSPKILAGKGRVRVILKAAGYNDEIKRDILENINKDVVFL